MAKSGPKTIKTNDLIMNGQVVSVDYVEFHGKPHYLVDSLLDAARRAFDFKRIETRLLAVPTKDHPEAIFECTIELTNGQLFRMHADASPNNVTQHIAGAYIRMAETRAVGRCLRVLTNVGTLAEEIHDDNTEQPVREYPKNEKEIITKQIRDMMDELRTARSNTELSELFKLIQVQVGPMTKQGLSGYDMPQLREIKKIIEAA